jgi:predicted transcriptional regulator
MDTDFQHTPKCLGMKKKPSSDMTPLELEVMRVLWQSEPATLQEVHRRMQETRALAYNTVQTMLTILHRKGKVKRVAEKRGYLYSAAVTHEKTAANAIRNLVDRLFGGKPESLVLNMVRNQQLTPEQIAELRALLDAKEGDGDGKS